MKLSLFFSLIFTNNVTVHESKVPDISDTKKIHTTEIEKLYRKTLARIDLAARACARKWLHKLGGSGGGPRTIVCSIIT